MSTNRRVALGCLGAFFLVLVVVGALVALNWDTVAKDLGEAAGCQGRLLARHLFSIQVLAVAILGRLLVPSARGDVQP